MKDQILKIAGVKSEKEFYKKYPTEEAFMAKHGKKLKKAAMGTAMVEEQLEQLTSWDNPPKAADGFDVMNLFGKVPTGATQNAWNGQINAAPGSNVVTKADTSALGFGTNAPTAGGIKGMLGGVSDKLGGAAGMLSIGSDIASSIQGLKEEKKQKLQAKQDSAMTGVLADASGTRAERVKNKYADQGLVQAINPQGAGTNFLAAYGSHIGGNPTEIQNTYNPGDLYSDLGYEPLDESNVKQFNNGGNVHKALFGMDIGANELGQAGGALGSLIGGGKGAPTAGGKLGSTLGKTVGNFIPIPGASQALSFIGGTVGGFFGGKSAAETQGFKDEVTANTDRTIAQNSGQAIQRQNAAFTKDGGWVSHDWQPQVITTFGEHKVKDLLQPPYDADMLRSGGSIGFEYYTPPSARAMTTDRAEDGTVLNSAIRAKTDLQSTTANGRFSENLRDAISSIDRYADGRPMEKTDMYSMTKGSDDNQRVKQFLRSQTGEDAPQYSMQKTYKPLFGSEYKTVSKEIGAGRGERRMADMEKFLSSDSMQYGGQMAMGGELETHWGGTAHDVSYNRFLPKSGKVAMLEGNYHDESDGQGNTGVGMSYGGNIVEAQPGEPIMELNDGGTINSPEIDPSTGKPNIAATVFGGRTTNASVAEYAGVEKGRTFQNIAKDIAKSDANINRKLDKTMSKIDDLKIGDSFDQLTANAYRATADGLTLQQAQNAETLTKLGDYQNRTDAFAKDLGLDINKLDKGKFVKSKESKQAAFGAKMETAQDGILARPQGFDPLRGRKPVNTYVDNRNPYNATLTNNLMYPGASRANFTTDTELSDRLTFGTPYVQPVQSVVQSAAAPMTTSTVKETSKGTSKGTSKRTGTAQTPFSADVVAGLKAMTAKGKGLDQIRRNAIGMYGQVPGAMPLPSSANVPDSEDITPIEDADKFGWKDAINMGLQYAAPFMRETDQQDLDPRQTYAERYAMATNQLEPVYAQQYNPMLKQSYDISLQDQLNEVDSQVRAATRQIGANPAAAAQIFAAASDAKNKIRGEQMRINQGNRANIMNENIGTMNQAQLKNMEILANQQDKMSRARSITRQENINALGSISTKEAEQRKANQNLAIMENMYGFRFGPRGIAINQNAPAQFNIPNVTGKQAGLAMTDSQGNVLSPTSYDSKTGKPTAYKVNPAATKVANGTKIKERNGSIVKALKNL